MFHIIPTKSFTEISQDGFFINNIDTGKWFFNSGIPELSLINWCNDNFIKEDKVFIDIGAHIGTYSWILGKKAKETYAFECNNEVYNCLCANIYLKQLSNKIIPHNIGLSSKPDTLKYYIRSKDGGGNGVEHIGQETNEYKLITVKRLDDYEIKNVSFIKIDTEGHELEVLKGAINTLKNNNYPPFLFESWGPHHGEDKFKLREPLFTFIRELNYKIISLNGYDDMFLAEYNSSM